MTIYEKIDALPTHKKEREKLLILSDDEGYMSFISSATNAKTSKIKELLLELYDEVDFFDKLNIQLLKLNELEDAGDLRFHAVTLYLVVRYLKPSTVVETGVAAGKSSAFILKALEMNDAGRLFSFDKIPTGGVAADGSKTSLANEVSAFLVDNSLRNRWILTYGDSVASIKLLAPILNEKVDIFIHDSLHTYEHTKLEYETLLDLNKRHPMVFMCDNLEMESGVFFEELKLRNLNYRFTNFGISVPS